MPNNNGHDNETRAQPTDTTPSAASPKDEVAARLREAGVSADRFVPIPDGDKRPIVDFRQSEDQYRADAIEGNYGVVGGGGLVIIDVDDYRDNVTVPPAIQQLPETLSVTSPHGGTHLYYAVDEPLSGGKFEWGEIRTDNQLVVGPGSHLDSCSKDWHDCATADDTTYTLTQAHPIRELPESHLKDIRELGLSSEDDKKSQPRNEGQKLGSVDVSDSEINVGMRLKKARRCAIGDKVGALLDGRYEDAGFPNDRSAAETALAHHLKFFLDNDEDLVYEVITAACDRQPRTANGKLRKWVERDEDYRWHVIESAYEPRETYEPPTPWVPIDERPKVGPVAYEDVLLTLAKIQPASKSEIASQERVDIKKRQVLNVLEKLEEEGLVSWSRDGRRTSYYIDVEPNQSC